jgi:phage terminase large subunit
MVAIPLPYMYEPRGYQVPFFEAMDSGLLRAALIWHRRSGKDLSCLNLMIKKMAERVGSYYYYFPTATLGRKALWNSIDSSGVKYLSHFPKEFIGKINDNEMRIEAVNGSIFQVIGADSLDVVGPNPIGNVFSEFSLGDPDAWNFVRPIVAENGGWAIMNYTPRGHNHGYHLYKMARKNPKWFCQILTVDDTCAVSKEAIDDERLSGMSEAMIQQEFYCSFDMPIQGSYYGRIFGEIQKQGRIGKYPLDLGYTTAVWFFQKIGTEVRILRYYEDEGSGVEQFGDIFDKFRVENKYKYNVIYVPCDMDSNATKIMTGSSALTTLRTLGYRCVPLPKEQRVIEGIRRTEKFLRDCTFNEVDCRDGIDSLIAYHEQVNARLSTDINTVYTGFPAKDGNDHPADSFRYLSLAFEKGLTGDKRGLSKERIRQLQAQYR